MDTGEKNAASPKRDRSERLRRIEKLVPAFAVGLVCITAVATALLVARPDAPAPVLEQADASADSKGVVQAPPLKMPAVWRSRINRKIAIRAYARRPAHQAPARPAATAAWSKRSWP